MELLSKLAGDVYYLENQLVLTISGIVFSTENWSDEELRDMGMKPVQSILSIESFVRKNEHMLPASIVGASKQLSAALNAMSESAIAANLSFHSLQDTKTIAQEYYVKLDNPTTELKQVVVNEYKSLAE